MKKVLITGVAGEVGSSLVQHLAREGGYAITGFDLRRPGGEIAQLCAAVVEGDIANAQAVQSLGENETFDTIFHLAGILSSGGEKAPLKAHEVHPTQIEADGQLRHGSIADE